MSLDLCAKELLFILPKTWAPWDEKLKTENEQRRRRLCYLCIISLVGNPRNLEKIVKLSRKPQSPVWVHVEWTGDKGSIFSAFASLGIFLFLRVRRVCLRKHKDVCENLSLFETSGKYFWVASFFYFLHPDLPLPDSILSKDKG